MTHRGSTPRTGTDAYRTGGSALTIAMIGTRGVPAAYGGFETAVEEIGRRLVSRGHRVLVYTRGGERARRKYLGMELVRLPAVPIKQAETLSHTCLSTVHAVMGHAPDIAFVFNAANAPFLTLLRARGIPAALHMDGLEWRRSKWGPRGRSYYRWAERFGVRHADALIADAPGIADYYRHQFDVDTEMIRYGAPILESAVDDGVRGVGLTPNGYHLVVARFEPENHVREIVEGYSNSNARLPLAVVGTAPYSAEYTHQIETIAARDDRIRLLGGVYDQILLDALYFHAFTYLHGHSVGGTNPSLLRAMGAGTAIVAFDVGFNRETAGNGWFFSDPDGVATAVQAAEADPESVTAAGGAARVRAAAEFDWNTVTRQYEALAQRLVAGASVHRSARHASRSPLEWAR